MVAPPAPHRKPALPLMIGGAELLPQYASVPIRFMVYSVFQLVELDGGLGGISFREQRLDAPYLKDMDLDESPLQWPDRFDLSHWTLAMAMDNGVPVGGAAVVWQSPELHILDGRDDVAVIWDLRVQPERRGQGIGSQLFRFAVNWARERHCCQVLVESQNVNVPACRFYQHQGCHLSQIDRYAYVTVPSVAHEVMLVWTINLGPVVKPQPDHS